MKSSKIFEIIMDTYNGNKISNKIEEGRCDLDLMMTTITTKQDNSGHFVTFTGAAAAASTPVKWL